MANDQVIAFAQRRFGTDSQSPENTGNRGGLPGWLDSGVLAQVAEQVRGSTQSSSRNSPDHDRLRAEVLVARDEDEPRTEGQVSRRASGPAADGTTADTFAFYLPFHFYRTTWGIYVRTSGIWSLAKRFGEAMRSLDATVLTSAYILLLEHERLHFLAEYAASRIEVVTGEARYVTYFGVADAGRHEEA